MVILFTRTKMTWMTENRCRHVDSVFAFMAKTCTNTDKTVHMVFPF